MGAWRGRERQTDIETGRQTSRQTSRQVDRQTYRQTEEKTKSRAQPGGCNADAIFVREPCHQRLSSLFWFRLDRYDCVSRTKPDLLAGNTDDCPISLLQPFSSPRQDSEPAYLLRTLPYLCKLAR
ncbi:uncharacterized protein LY79DRAFT_549032 [Colletotrichum navitas]|uniref:Uncharacterized protein n=1 Tax=Colletotrichum navitas TaxID=681940 RepID=A0AAD8Q3U6_9PEZI|nr:uncharacterized protein LY79DRAFT_549032 [Colletotrichum navitas]KAK1594552.1 hypothetical protein LY79DRAFT_549032 [Colletotrichum navitas]